MSDSTKTTLIDIYDAWRARDLDWLATYLPADFSHSMNIPAETLSLSGMRDGKLAALDRLKDIFKSFDTQHLEPGELVLCGDKVVADVTTRCMHRPSGKWLCTTKKHVWRMEDGWPVELFEFYDLDEFDDFIRKAQSEACR
jgi:ketosteroid isomerase-like protein